MATTVVQGKVIVEWKSNKSTVILFEIILTMITAAAIITTPTLIYTLSVLTILDTTIN